MKKILVETLLRFLKIMLVVTQTSSFLKNFTCIIPLVNIVDVGGDGGGGEVMAVVCAHVWWKDDFVESVFRFYFHIGARNPTQQLRFARRVPLPA